MRVKSSATVLDVARGLQTFAASVSQMSGQERLLQLLQAALDEALEQIALGNEPSTDDDPGEVEALRDHD
jgi:hypothetical protein